MKWTPAASEIGQRHGRLMVLGIVGRGHSAIFECLCDCGATCQATLDAIRCGDKRSCGCLRKEIAARNGAAQLTTHGLSRGTNQHPLYKIWGGMRNRCSNPSNPDFPYYGARGIRVCSRWDDFTLFVADVGVRPSPKHSIDRINNDGHYEPGNVRWATYFQQARNRRKPTRRP